MDENPLDIKLNNDSFGSNKSNKEKTPTSEAMKKAQLKYYYQNKEYLNKKRNEYNVKKREKRIQQVLDELNNNTKKYKLNVLTRYNIYYDENDKKYKTSN